MTRRTLIRRLTLDLTGLLPSPEETAAFLSDESEDALERLAWAGACESAGGRS